jgi:hypothetical protein
MDDVTARIASGECIKLADYLEERFKFATEGVTGMVVTLEDIAFIICTLRSVAAVAGGQLAESQKRVGDALKFIGELRVTLQSEIPYNAITCAYFHQLGFLIDTLKGDTNE